MHPLRIYSLAPPLFLWLLPYLSIVTLTISTPIVASLPAPPSLLFRRGQVFSLLPPTLACHLPASLQSPYLMNGLSQHGAANHNDILTSAYTRHCISTYGCHCVPVPLSFSVLLICSAQIPEGVDADTFERGSEECRDSCECEPGRADASNWANDHTGQMVDSSSVSWEYGPSMGSKVASEIAVSQERSGAEFGEIERGGMRCFGGGNAGRRREICCFGSECKEAPNGRPRNWAGANKRSYVVTILGKDWSGSRLRPRTESGF